MIRPLDRKPPQQIGIHSVLRVRDGGARLPVDRLQAQQPHQPPHPVPTDRHPFARQMAHHLAATVERIAQVQLVDTPHQRQGFCALADRLVVQRRGGSAPAAGTDGSRSGSGDRVRPSSVAGLLSAPEPARQKIALHGQLADLRVQVMPRSSHGRPPGGSCRWRTPPAAPPGLGASSL